MTARFRIFAIEFRSSIGLCALVTVSKRLGDHLGRPSMDECETELVKHLPDI